MRSHRTRCGTIKLQRCITQLALHLLTIVYLRKTLPSTTTSASRHFESGNGNEYMWSVYSSSDTNKERRVSLSAYSSICTWLYSIVRALWLVTHEVYLVYASRVQGLSYSWFINQRQIQWQSCLPAMYTSSLLRDCTAHWHYAPVTATPPVTQHPALTLCTSDRHTTSHTTSCTDMMHQWPPHHQSHNILHWHDAPVTATPPVTQHPALTRCTSDCQTTSHTTSQSCKC